MLRKLLFIFLLLAGCKSTSVIDSVNQKTDHQQILFTVNGEGVTAEEFKYVYSKNNINNDSAFTKTDIKEYLDLYVNFKLKIQEAESRGMDKSKAFVDEFNGYREQLKKPYLTENKVTERLVSEAYDRFKYEVRASHILINAKEDTLDAYKKIREIKNQLDQGASFENLAKQYSQDPSVKVNGGDLGYFTSFQMVYPFESAAYQTKVGEVSAPTRTQFGYHLVKVKDRRPANGKVQVAHIMLRAKSDTTAVRNKIFEIYDQVKGGVEWAELVKLYSEDVNSRNTNGVLRAFSVGQMPLEFQEASFTLVEPGEISDPVKTQYGWHIIKLINREPIESFEQMEASIKSRISRDSRAQLNEIALIKRLKKENGFIENAENRKIALSITDSTLLQGNWKYISSAQNDLELFKIADKTHLLNEFATYIEENQKPVKDELNHYTNVLYNDFQKSKIIAYEEDHLADKYFDYKMIVKEYREGILLFNLMEEEVWNRAVEDTVGLEAFYESRKDNYKWGERAKASIYSASDKILLEISNAIETEDSLYLTKQSLYKKYNSGSNLILQSESGIFESGVKEVLDLAEWNVGVQKLEFGGKSHLVWIKEILPPQIKTLQETKGAVISDYQEVLEKNWLVKLKEKYSVSMNNEVLNNVYESLQK
ncbi:foldase protein PrsA [Fulvivirga lutimaris]|uniref:foldase protein PrsA n=1 Tax=Fulvivirga lutimaris TaxID=1819566 RepID=UPI0016243D76|nr:peptidylprolyl isomerase [Fulvivirga lutimaris]